MDFDLAEWKVEREATDLTNRLFGSYEEVKQSTNSLKEKKKSHRKRKFEKEISKNVSSDTSDSKKEVKHSKSSKCKNTENTTKSLELNSNDSDGILNVSKKRKKVQYSPKVKEKGSAREEGEKSQQKDSGDKSQRKDSEDKNHKKAKIKRKRKLTDEGTENCKSGSIKTDTESSGKKRRLKLEDKSGSPTKGGQLHMSDNGTEGTGKKRKKKKRPNNKRNKYKHLDEARKRMRDQTNPGKGDTDPSSEIDMVTEQMGVASSRLESKQKNKVSTNKAKEKESGKDGGVTAGTTGKKGKKKKAKSKSEVRDGSESEHGVNNTSDNSVKSESEQAVNSNVNNKSKHKLNKKMKPALNVDILRNVLSQEKEEKSIVNKTKDKSGNVSQKDSPKTKVNVKNMSLREKMMNQLNSARFRYINEQLYTRTGQDARLMFQEDRESYAVYHQGFHTQVQKWPTNPVDVIIKQIQAGPKHHVVADFGCGDAKIARSVQQTVHSFDLVALNDRVTACNMANVPLPDGSVNVAVFCLSLMGTNLNDYLLEANRVMKSGGTLKIAEVTSRFSSIPRFIVCVEKFGFRLLKKDESNKMFVSLDFKKTGEPQKSLPELSLNPCVYKKR